MKRYEYDHVRFAPGLWNWISKKRFNEQLTSLLNQLGSDGWELKSSFHEALEMHLHLVFAREKESHTS